MNRYTLLVTLLAILFAGMIGEADRSEQATVTDDFAPVVFVAGNDKLPDWAQSPSNGGSRDMPPPAAAPPGLPGPPSMPLSGIALLALAGGALAWRRLQSTER